MVTEPTPLTDAELAAIAARATEAETLAGTFLIQYVLAQDIPRLLAEVRRLREALRELTE